MAASYYEAADDYYTSDTGPSAWWGRAVHTGGQTLVYLTPMHAEVGLIKRMIANIQAAIAYVKRAAEQLPKLNRWHALVDYICERITRQTILPTPPPALQGAG